MNDYKFIDSKINSNKIINKKRKKRKKSPKIKRLIFEGGGTKCLALVGVLQEISQYVDFSNITQFGGSSAGGILALLLSLGYNVSEIKYLIKSIKFHKFKDDSFGIIRDIRRFINEYGLYKGDYFYNLIKKIIKGKNFKSDITFLDLYKKTGNELLLTGTNLNHRRTDYFHYKTSPFLEVAKAVRITMSIPCLFKSVRYEGNVYVDGGMLNNYPFDAFYITKILTDRKLYTKHAHLISNNLLNPKYVPKEYINSTLGIRVDTPIEIHEWKSSISYKMEINSINSFVEALIESFISTIEKLRITDEFIEQTILVSSENSSLNFNLTDADKSNLINQGVIAGKNYFKLKEKRLDRKIKSKTKNNSKLESNLIL